MVAIMGPSASGKSTLLYSVWWNGLYISTEDKLNGLLLGADDYIEKPYDIDILIAKIQGIFKRRYETNLITDNDLVLNKNSRTVLLNRTFIIVSLIYVLIIGGLNLYLSNNLEDQGNNIYNVDPSTRSRDMVDKLNTYMISKVGEYWIVDPNNNTIILYGFKDLKIDSFRTFKVPVCFYFFSRHFYNSFMYKIFNCLFAYFIGKTSAFATFTITAIYCLF